MHLLGLVPLDEVWRVPVSSEKVIQFFVADSGKHAGIGDFVTVQMQDWQNHTVSHGIEKLVGMPAGGEGSGLGLAVADNAGDDQIGIVVRRTVRVRDRVSE